MNKVAVYLKTSAKKIDIGGGYAVTKIGKDSSGNSCIWVEHGRDKPKKIQMVGVISDSNNVKIEKMNYFNDLSDTKVKRTIEQIKNVYSK